MPKLGIGEKFNQAHGNYSNSGPYEVVELVFSARSVSYRWTSGLTHPRLCDSCYVCRKPDGEHVIVAFSDDPYLTKVTCGNCSQTCPRCGAEMQVKKSFGLIGPDSFDVKKCASCGYCC